MVIGESARSASWSLYGYARPTTPQVAACLDKAGGLGVCVPDALAAGRLTMNSVPSLLSPAPAKDFLDYCSTPSVIQVFRAAGYRTASSAASSSAPSSGTGRCNLMLNDAHSVERFAKDDDLPAALDSWLGQDAAAAAIGHRPPGRLALQL